MEPSVRRPKYHEIVDAEETRAEAAILGEDYGDDDDGAVIDASHPLPGASGRGGPDDEEAYLGQRWRPSDDSSRGVDIDPSRGAGRGGGLMPGEGRGPGRPPTTSSHHHQQQLQAGEISSPQIDPVAWQTELERLAPQLSRIFLPADGTGGAASWGEWHGRWQGFKSTASGISAAAPEAAAALRSSGSVVTADMDRIAATERRLNSASEALTVQHRAARQRLAEIQVRF